MERIFYFADNPDKLNKLLRNMRLHMQAGYCRSKPAFPESLETFSLHTPQLLLWTLIDLVVCGRVVGQLIHNLNVYNNLWTIYRQT